MRVRKVVNRSGRNYRGYFPSKKLNRMVHFESLLECDAALLFEFSPGVKTYQEQPAVITYEYQASTHRYIPDYALQLVDDRTIHIEVKTESALRQPAIQDKYAQIARHYEGSETGFLILTERELRAEPLRSNLKQLARAQRSHMANFAIRQQVLEALNQDAACSYLSLSQRFGHAAILGMLAHFELVCDLHRPLDTANDVRLFEEEDHASLLF